jgi:R3H domain
VSVAASDDVDVTSTSTATDPSEQDHNTDDKSAPSPRVPSPNASRGPVLLLRRQPVTPATTSSRQVAPTPDIRQPSPSRLENAMHTPVKEAVDPSLLEAFANPMNRQYLLQLEGSLNSFVTQSRYLLKGISDSRTDSMELPPTNSFFRCLAHKMADHYRLQHVADSGHVVLFRSPYARMYPYS